MSGIDINQNFDAKTAKLDPPWTQKNKKKEERKEWFKNTLKILEDFSEYRIQSHVNNILWYTGDYDKTLEYRLVVPGQGEKQVPRKVLPRIFSHLYDITEQRVSKLSRYKPSFEVVPTNSEQKDWEQSRLYKIALDATARRVNMDFLMQEVERWAAVCGEVLVDIEYDSNIGDRKNADTYERVGDVNIKLKEPWKWLPEPKRRREDVKWGIDIYEILHIDEARKKYNKSSMEPDGQKWIFGFNRDIEEKREDEIVIYRLIEIPSVYNPEGAITYYANGEEINKESKYPYAHFGFPFEWHTDIDIPGRLFPVSFYQHLQPIQHVYNRLTSIMVRNALLVGHPHVLMPKGAAKIEAFGNAPTAIEYSGPTEPRIVTWPSIPQEFFALRKEVRDELGIIGGIQGVSRGSPPTGVRAASMLRFYEEQEEQRASTQILKHNDFIRRVFIKAASIIGEYYPATDKNRLIRVLGKENEFMVDAFIGSKPSSEYDVIIVNSTGFSESKAARLEELQMIEQFAPGMLSPEQKADILELRNTKKAYDVMTAALRQAEQENEMFMDGKDVPAPKAYQDLIVHWKQHMIMMNSSTWETRVTQKRKDKVFEHMTMTERLMAQKAETNAFFASQLQLLPNFPVFWNIASSPQPQAPQPAAPMAAPPNGAMPPTPEPQAVEPQMNPDLMV